MKHKQPRWWIGLHALLSVVGMLLLVVFASRDVRAAGNVLEGQVFDQTGKPVAGYPISVRSMGGAATSSAAITDGEGKFRLYGLPPGRYQVIPLNQPEATRKEVTIEPGGGKASVQLNVHIR